MRTGGDDIAQGLALWGCEPVWEPVSGRVIDFQILPLSVLGRPGWMWFYVCPECSGVLLVMYAASFNCSKKAGKTG
ncbi:MAG: hypothetical protein CM1200mP30_11480 [Pseudomonadota bacterium]|nr:MAG: hypothetical protein CM1200mP30_11480 [Pseudomonadota bacterium]